MSVCMAVLYDTVLPKRLSVSYLKLCKAGVKHDMLVNDHPQGYDGRANPAPKEKKGTQ